MTTIWDGAFVLCCGALLTLPFVPALVEWLRPSDVAPLPVIRDHEGDIRAFAIGFMRLINDEALKVLAEVRRDLSNDRLIRVGRHAVRVLGDPAAWAMELQAEPTIREGLLACSSLCIPPRSCCDRELYAQGEVVLGATASARAVMADGDISLGKNSQVLRWIDAGGALFASEGACLFGRAVSAGTMTLGTDVRFERLYAPRIVTGLGGEDKPGVQMELVRIDSGGRLLDDAGRFRRIDGDYEVDSSTLLDEHIVVTGALRIGALARIAGSVKAYGRVTLETGAAVEGAVSCGGDLALGRDAFVAGPIMCERKVSLDSGAWVGAFESPTTLTAHRVLIAEGVTLYGSVWARNEGITVRGSFS